MDALRPLLGTTLVLVAHPDDEVILCGALMQKMQRAVVVFSTDGAPRDEGFWRQYGSRQAYAEVRRQEARQALDAVGACPVFLSDRVDDGIADQELFRRLPEAVTAVKKIVAHLGPDCILTPAYEGGHPDHDAACFIGWVVGRHASLPLPVWEGPLYHRRADGASAPQTFPELTGFEVELRAECGTLQKKIEMWRAYKSQGLVLDGFRADLETFRPMAAYEFSRPPLPWKLNYEQWGWGISGAEVSAAFAACVRGEARGSLS
ncbi:MAG TPA: PIG-L family deacetylase [Candidatus Angelobacter sp.]